MNTLASLVIMLSPNELVLGEVLNNTQSQSDAQTQL